MKLVLNFGHMLVSRSVEFLQQKLESFEYLHVRLRVDFGKPLAPQVVRAVDQVEWDLEKLRLPSLAQAELYVVMPPLDDPAVLLAVEIHGRTGNFPNLLMLKRDGGEHVIYEVVDLEKLRLTARCKRKSQTLTPTEVPATCNETSPPNSA